MDAPGPAAAEAAAAYLRTAELFQDLDPPVLAAIAAGRRTVRAGAFLFRQDDPAHLLYATRRGRRR